MNCVICGKFCPQNYVTCSDTCHEIFVHKMEQEVGGYKKVVDMVTGKAHRVPTRYIIENGLKQMELKNFPEWESNERRA